MRTLKSMKLLFVHERFGAMAGAEVNAFLTAEELRKRGHSTAILHGEPTGKGEDAWRTTFQPSFAIPETASGAAVERALAEFQPDVIYVHKMEDPGVIEALVKSGKPLVRMVHDHDLYCMRSYKYHPLTRKICTRPASPHCIFPCGAVIARNRGGGLPLKWVSYGEKLREIALNRRFHRMVVATEYMREELLRNKFDPAKIEIHSPVPPTPAGLLEASFSDRNLIIYSGQIIRGKGVDVLMEALALVGEKFECEVFGDGNHRAHCEFLRDKFSLAGKVHFRGFVPRNEVLAAYSDASLAVVSSVWPEPFGAVGLEAMHHGLPVVAFDAGGVREWLADGENGFLAPWMDRKAFAGRVAELLRDKALARKMGARGRAMAAEKFDFARYIGALEAMFTQVLAENGKP